MDFSVEKPSFSNLVDKSGFTIGEKAGYPGYRETGFSIYWPAIWQA